MRVSDQVAGAVFGRDPFRSVGLKLLPIRCSPPVLQTRSTVTQVTTNGDMGRTVMVHDAPFSGNDPGPHSRFVVWGPGPKQQDSHLCLGCSQEPGPPASRTSRAARLSRETKRLFRGTLRTKNFFTYDGTSQCATSPTGK